MGESHPFGTRDGHYPERGRVLRPRAGGERLHAGYSCLYPGFGRHLPSVEAPVNGVLAHLPVRPDQPLTLRQALSPYLLDSTLTRGHPKRQVSQWQAQMQRAPGYAATASAIYLPVGSWPAAGGRLADAHFDVALAAAEWAVRLPAQATGNPNGPVFLPCVPRDQAREAIAIWLAILAARPPAGELADGLDGLETARGFQGVEVRNTIATAGLALSCAAMRDRWHRYTRSLHRPSSPPGQAA